MYSFNVGKPSSQLHHYLEILRRVHKTHTEANVKLIKALMEAEDKSSASALAPLGILTESGLPTDPY